MKRVLLIVSSMVVISVVALGQQGQGDADRRTAQQKRLAEDDVALKSLIRRTAFSGHEPSPTVQGIATVFKIPPERMAKILEEIIREGLSDMEKAEGDAKTSPSHQVSAALRQLKDFRSPNTLKLIKECAIVSKNDRIRCTAVQAYIENANRDGGIVDFLREVVTEGHLSGMSRYEVYQSLGGIVGYKEGFLTELKVKNKNDDAEKLLVFMLDRVLVEQEWFGVYQLDSVLCINLDGYAQSIQRAQIVQKFVNSKHDWVRNRFGEIKAEIDKIPAGQRTDLSQRFKLPPAPQ